MKKGWVGMCGNLGKLGRSAHATPQQICASRKHTVFEIDKIVRSPPAATKIAQICNYSEL